jgi:hypothetical protein
MKPLGLLGSVVPVLALGASACGANNSPGEPPKYSATAVLADFEASVSLNPDTPRNRWSPGGNFIASADTSKDGIQLMKQQPLMPPRVNPDGSMSTGALHVSDNGLHTFWGSAWLAYLGASQTQSGDLSEFTGISLWMKSDGLPVPTVKVALPDFYSFPIPVPPGTPPPGCDMTDNSVGGKGCYDDYAVKLYPDGQWRRYEIPFSALFTGGWGYPHRFDSSQVFAIKFAMLPEAKYDIWVDDIVLFVR